MTIMSSVVSNVKRSKLMVGNVAQLKDFTENLLRLLRLLM